MLQLLINHFRRFLPQNFERSRNDAFSIFRLWYFHTRYGSALKMLKRTSFLFFWIFHFCKTEKEFNFIKYFPFLLLYSRAALSPLLLFMSEWIWMLYWNRVFTMRTRLPRSSWWLESFATTHHSFCWVYVATVASESIHTDSTIFRAPRSSACNSSNDPAGTKTLFYPQKT